MNKALSVAFTGFGPTREIDTLRMVNAARSLEEFRAALPYFVFGSQNFAYADVDGNIAYFTSAEMPIRTDLQNGTIAGLPPYFIRNGTTSANDWMPVVHPQPHQALPYEILTADEMPRHLVNPASGWFVNCNNNTAMNLLLDQSQAATYLLQGGPLDTTFALPFSNRVLRWPGWTAAPPTS